MNQNKVYASDLRLFDVKDRFERNAACKDMYAITCSLMIKRVVYSYIHGLTKNNSYMFSKQQILTQIQTDDIVT